jgi:hypothetical protein
VNTNICTRTEWAETGSLRTRRPVYLGVPGELIYPPLNIVMEGIGARVTCTGAGCMRATGVALPEVTKRAALKGQAAKKPEAGKLRAPAKRAGTTGRTRITCGAA